MSQRFFAKLVRRRKPGLGTVGPQFRSHATLLAHAPSHLDDLLWPKLGKTEPANGFHVNENVGCSFTAGQEAEASDAVEPLHHRTLPITLGRHDDVGSLRQL
jgi:hypothetical protein